MQYVLTKDKRLLIAPDLTSAGGRVLMSDPPKYEVIDALGRHLYIDTGEVAKQADTIEGLCDEFVISYDICASDDIEEGKHKAREMLECSDIMVDYLRRNYTGSSHRIYGAIWIEGEHGEDILKSVAIMNKKGKFELL